GLVRFYYITEDGKEYNKSFSQENQFAGAIQYTFQPEPGRFYIQALEPTRALAISLQGLNRLYQHSLPWANLGRLQMEALAVKKTAREAGFLLDSAEQRYRSFLEEEPGLARRLPLYQIASFLGITDVALSRIRRRIK
ncbi:MAG: Crp/Fnr family transcriptional regulator, partial [Gammaproteobacteria bacterium]|nr:Crp/Fnr family transcriptional regulator [Gammaproteobacteria bacterium]